MMEEEKVLEILQQSLNYSFLSEYITLKFKPTDSIRALFLAQTHRSLFFITNMYA